MATFIKIASITVGSGGAASIDFTSIPATYTDLVVKLSLREATGTNWAAVWEFNNSSSSYSARYLQGNGAAASSVTNTAASIIENSSGATANTFGNAEIYIPNYAGSSYKSSSSDSISETNATTSFARLSADLWSNTAAVTSIKFTLPGATNFAQYSTAVLYGIKNS